MSVSSRADQSVVASASRSSSLQSVHSVWPLRAGPDPSGAGTISSSRVGKVLTMITIRAGKAAITLCLLMLAGCSREQQDWRAAEAADSIEAYDQFIQHHPESELATQARTRVAQLGEDRDWQHAGSADNVEAYRQFITQH